MSKGGATCSKQCMKDRMCSSACPLAMARAEPVLPNPAISNGAQAILVVSPLVISPLVALMEDQLYILKKHGVRALILGSSTSVAKENIATVECLGRDNFFFFSSGSPYHSEVVRCL